MGITLKLMLKGILFILLIKNVITDEECTKGWKSMGYTSPKGDIAIKYGDPLDIYCTLNEEEVKKIGPNASQYLMFQVNSNKLEKEMVQVINSSTIKLHVDKPNKTSGAYYYCNFNDTTAVCNNVVIVGVPPQPVEDFHCRSQNLDNLTCNWTAPENYVYTDYNLSYSINTNMYYTCPKVERSNNNMSCQWSLKTDPIYRQTTPDYYFFLNISNVFGTYRMPRIHFNHFKHVRPGRPENLKVLNRTWNSINLTWTVPTTMETFSRGLYHRIKYQTNYQNNTWTIREPIFKKEVREVVYNLNNLEFAHTLYDVQVSLLSGVADPTDESLWSDYAGQVIRTMNKKPDDPPSTTIGSFEILGYGNNSERNVRIYWSTIAEQYRNGENFNYVVNIEGRDENYTTEHAYMVIERLSLYRSYTFYIRSQNERGISDKKATIHIPDHRYFARGPTKLTKEELGGGKYRITWQAPKLESHQILENYTIFWCNDERELPPCNGNLSWTDVPPNYTSYEQNIPSNKTYQFAVAANIIHGSSGMTWIQCTDLYYKDSVGKINEFYRSHEDSNSIEVNWSFGCSDKSVTGFIIFYCPIKSPEQNANCKEPTMNVTIPKGQNKARISNLTPYTTYGLEVAAIINHTTRSQLSEKILGTTLEAAPSTPTNLKVTNVTNSTISITWEPPVKPNGIIKTYKIFYNDIPKTIDCNTSFILTNLESYVNYDISVQACTSKCSNSSEIVKIQTKIGYPGIMNKPSIDQNSTYTLISWDKPQRPNGRNEHYELRIKEKHDYKNVTTIINTTEKEWGMHSCDKEKMYSSFYVSVRAVNMDNSKLFNGPWSNEVESYCRPPSNFIIYILVPVIILFLLGMTYLFKKIYGHFKEMRDVGVKLPHGLQGIVIETEMLPSRKQKPTNDDADNHTADDEQLLLKKKSEFPPNSNVDSSGCSSAHDSVTCSLDSASNISSSTSDSGTEQPRTPSTEDLNELGVNTSLRQRNTRPSSIAKPYVSLPLDSNASSGSKMAVKSYCILGVDTNDIKTECNSSYVPLPPLGDKLIYSPNESQQPSSPYVLTGELMKTVNPGYIPYKTDVCAKNPAYVIAGSKDLLSPGVLNTENKNPVTSPDSSYVKIADNLALKNADVGWKPPSLCLSNTKTGYVSIGEAPVIKKESKGYVPHRQFENKSLKED